MALAHLDWTLSARAATTVTDAALIADIKARAIAAGWTVVSDPDTYGIACYAPGLSDDLAIIFAAKDASVGTPTMLSPDTATTGVLLVGMVKGAPASGGASLNWDAASPLGSGTFSGFYRGVTYSGSTHLTMMFSAEALALFLDASGASATIKAVVAGAWIDPLSTATANCETNGRVYGMWVTSVATTGLSATGWNGTSATSATASALFTHAAANGNCHVGSFVPRSSSWRTVNATSAISGVAITTTNLRGEDVAQDVSLPFAIFGTTFHGVTRGITIVPDGRHAATRQTVIAGPSTVDAVYLAGMGGTGADGDCIGFEARSLV